jgi:NADH:ubiquinone oxidoreductase subunit 5 (subunit L)/multisubunit Na+/H+ antiporter MnhA subunit
MFVGVGAGAYVSGVFHLVTHAFFKALLFLGSGSVIFAMHRAYHATHNDDDAQDMRNMGGLKRYMPWTFWLMLAATLAIAGIFPFAGFFSKDEILGTLFLRARGSTLADAHWLGIPGGIVLSACYGLGLAAAVMPAVSLVRLLISTVLLFLTLTQQRELDALKAAGISLYRASLPILLVAFSISVTSGLLQETVLPGLNAKAEEVDRVKIRGNQPRHLQRQTQIW